MSSLNIPDSGFSSPVHDTSAPLLEQRLKYFPKYEPYNPKRPVRVIIVGAGIAGIATAALLPEKVPNLQVAIYEKNTTVGGTWAENVYPGVRCDVPSHVYQLTFAPNTNWTEYYPKGDEIREYYEKVVRDFGIDKNLHLQHEVVSAVWLEEASQWEVIVKDLVSGDIKTDIADFFVSAQGRLNSWKYPDIPGLQTKYQGHLAHTSKFDKNFDPTGKKIAIIGNGASGQQLLPNIISQTEHIDHYIRSKTWVSPSFRGDLFEATAAQPGGPQYTEEQKKQWAENPQSYLDFRRELEAKFHGRFQGSILGSPENEAFRNVCTETMLRRLNGDQEWLDRLIPRYAPGCKRPTPAPGYIESLISPKVEFITDSIVEATETGLITADGKLREVDAIIAATGHHNGFLPRFPTIGQDGIDLSKLWAPNGSIGYPESYFGIMAPKFPNYFFILQAQGNGGGGSVPLQCEISATYIAKAIRKIQSESYASLQPNEDATRDFNEVVEGHFDDKVLGDDCDSWLKAGKGKKRVLAAWPGTGHHRFDICRNPRWEDFVFKRREGAQGNRYEYFGNGWTEREKEGDSVHVTNYLHEVGKVDLATLHESWNE